MQRTATTCWHQIGLVLGLLSLLGVLSVGRAQPEVRSGLRAEPTLVGNVPAHTVRFDHLTITDGLSQNAVYAIEQDHRGFMWFGTKNGLNRYDGYTFTVFQHAPFDSTSISSSHITALLEDHRNFLWVGTRNGGLNRFDREREVFYHYPNGPTDPITSIEEDREGNLWIGTEDRGLYLLQSKEVANPRAPFEHFTHDPKNPRSLGSNRVNDVLVDRQGTMWVASPAGLDQFDTSKRSGRSEGFIRHRLDLEIPPGMDDVGATALYEDREGQLWAGSASGISLFRRSTKHFIHYYHRYHTFRYGWGTVTQLLEARDGRIWMASYAALMHFDPETKSFIYFQHDSLDPQSMSSNSPTALFQDRSEVLWVGTNGYGINVYDPKADRFQIFRPPRNPASRLAGFSVYMVFEDKAGHVWIHAGVLYKWNRETGALTSFETSSNRPDDFGNTGVWSMEQDAQGDLWAGTHQGLYRYNPETGRYRQYKHDPTRPDGLPEKVVYGVYQDRDGALWTVTANYFSKLTDRANGRFKHYRYKERPTSGTWAFPSLYQDARGIFWLASSEGLVRFDPDAETFRHYRHDPHRPNSLSNDLVRTICPDPQHPEKYLWLGTAGGGLNRFDVENERFTHFTEKDGLPNNVVYGILPDEEGHLWMSTNEGLSRFDPRTGAFRNYDVNDGLQSNEFNSGAYFKSTRGELFFGGLYGFNYFYPERVKDNPHVPEVVITGVNLSNHPISAGDSSGVLEKVISETDALRLSYLDNVITFEFAALDYSAPENNRYAYLMEGFNDTWIEAGTARSATYTNLPPGSYTFRVKGSNNDGLWNEEGAALALIITPPWWQTWWAYGAYGLIFLAGVFAVDRIQRRRLIRRERARARLREAEIHAEAAEKQSETLRHLDEIKSRFFANISHEFRTPLTLTIGPLEDLRSGFYGELDARADEQVELALRNARRVLRLINELLDLSKLEAGQLKLSAQRADLAPFLRRIASLYQPLAERRAITFQLDLPDAPVPVDFDPDQLEKVFANLLSNAFKFTPEGGSVRLTLKEEEPVAQGRDHVAVHLRDSGPGIPAAELDRIFERFYQVGTPESHLQPGTGIGLALAWELVQLHGGTLEVESDEGFGSTFTVRLPREQDKRVQHETRPPDRPLETRPETAQRAAASLAEVTQNEEGAAFDKDMTTVLVVEDNPEMRRYIRNHLTRHYRVVEATDGEEGLAKARKLLPDLVVSDVMMPKMDGYALCQALKQDPELDYVPVILLTAKASRADVLEGLSGGADDYLTKPFDVQELRARIDNLIASRQHLRERFGSGPFELHASEVDAISSDEAFLACVQSVIEAHLGDERFTVEALAEEVGLSRVHLYRRLRNLADQSPSDLIRSIRLERATQLLTQQAGSISEIAYGVGFKSVSHFSRSFREQCGCTPTEYADRSPRGNSSSSGGTGQ